MGGNPMDVLLSTAWCAQSCPIDEDLRHCPAVEARRVDAMAKLERENDFVSLSMDGCLKTVLKITSVIPRHRRGDVDFTEDDNPRPAATLLTLKSASSAFVGCVSSGESKSAT